MKEEITLDDIIKRLDSIEDLLGWKMLAADRFDVGEKVTFSPKAFRKRIASRRKSTTGKVTKVSTHYSIEVLLDGYKRPSSFHHSFFDPIE